MAGCKRATRRSSGKCAALRCRCCPSPTTLGVVTCWLPPPLVKWLDLTDTSHTSRAGEFTALLEKAAAAHVWHLHLNHASHTCMVHAAREELASTSGPLPEREACPPAERLVIYCRTDSASTAHALRIVLLTVPRQVPTAARTAEARTPAVCYRGMDCLV